MSPLDRPSQTLDFNVQNPNALVDSDLVLKTATYVKVSDIAKLNHLDLEKIKTVTEQKSLELGDSGSLSHSSKSSEKKDRGISSTKHQQCILPASNGFNLCLLVGRIEVVVQKTRVDMSQVLLAECEVGDETGIVSLRCRNEQIPLLQEISKSQGAVVLRNCSIELYQGKYIRLSVNKWGKISTYPDSVQSTPNPPKDMNKSLNLSIIDTNIAFEGDILQSQDKISPPPREASETNQSSMWNSSKSTRGKRGSRGYNTYKSSSTNAPQPGHHQFYPGTMFPYFSYSHSRIEAENRHDQQAMLAFQHQYDMQYQMGNMMFHHEQMSQNNLPIYPDLSRNLANVRPQGYQQFSSRFSNYSFSPTAGRFDHLLSSSISPIGRMDASQVSFSESEDYSICQQESPMMNPNASSFFP